MLAKLKEEIEKSLKKSQKEYLDELHLTEAVIRSELSDLRKSLHRIEQKLTKPSAGPS